MRSRLDLARVAVIATLLATSASTLADDRLRTIAERSGFRETGRYAEVVALCEAFRKAFPQSVLCVEFGRTPEGRPMHALVASRSGALTALDARRRGVPVVLIQGGIHAGEIDGKDAGFLALRELLERRAAPDALDRLVLVFVPVFNVDGHERFGHWNRPNQRGPDATGWRTTAQNFNLNRDYLKADTPEMQAMLRLVNAWDPLACVDLHVTDGAKFEHDISIQVEPVHAGDDALRTSGRAMRDRVIADLALQGSLPQPFYMSLRIDDDPASGFVDGVSPPRFSTGYFYLRNRFGMLVETHSWKDYQTRVRVTRNAIVSVLEQVARNGARWLAQARQADHDASMLAGQRVPLEYEASERSRMIEFRGYEYTRTHSEISGALMTRYDESRPQVWNVSLRDDVVPAASATAPRAGYLVPAAHAGRVRPKLEQHGVSYDLLRQPWSGARLETFRADKATFSPRSTEGHQRLAVEGRWHPEVRDVGAGALYVPIAQANARLVVALFEPEAPDSLVAWGMFNTAFERKEYMEAYVAEGVARAQLAADRALVAEFESKLATDPEFAKSPAARLEFFYRRHPSWDERYNLYPVMRTDDPPEASIMRHVR